MVRPFHFRLSKVPGRGRRQSAGRLPSWRVVRTGAPSTVKKSRGATMRKSASPASWLARSRALSVRSPSAKACSRQAMRRNRCSRCRHRVSSSNTSRYFARRAAKLTRQLFDFHQHGSLQNALLSVAVNHQSHERSLGPHRQAKSELNSQDFWTQNRSELPCLWGEGEG